MAILAGAGTPDARARPFVAVDGGHGHLAISGLRPLRAGRTYQLWFFRSAAPAAAGAAFRVDAHGRAWVKVETSLAGSPKRVGGSGVLSGAAFADGMRSG